jgi:hypothetical protein
LVYAFDTNTLYSIKDTDNLDNTLGYSNISSGGGGGGGDVFGPGTSTDNTIARWNGTAGDAIQGTGIVIDDSNNVSGVEDLTIDGTLDFSGATFASALPVAGGGTASTTAAAARVALNPACVQISASAIDWSLSEKFYKTLSANTTFTFSNATDGQTIVVALTNTASNYTVTWPTVAWTAATAPTQTTGAKTDIYTFIKVGSTVYGSAVQNLS